MPSIPAPTLKFVESFTVTGLTARTQNSDELNEKTARLPGLWQRFYSTDLATDTRVFEVYSDYESEANGLYTVTLGVVDDNERAQFNPVKIESGNYLVFEGAGPMPSTVVETWKQIWNYFDLENRYQRSFITDFEAYGDSGKVAVYIGIK